MVSLPPKFVSCFLRKTTRRKCKKENAELEHERNTVQLQHDQQHDPLALLGKTLSVLMELLPVDSKALASVSVVVLFF